MTITWPRAGGILAHPTSFPGPHGIGDLGPGAERFFDFLATAGQTLWQTLPLGPTGYGASPYAALSAFAGNPALISPERLIEDGLLDRGGCRAAARLPRAPGGLRRRDRLEDAIPDATPTRASPRSPIIPCARRMRVPRAERGLARRFRAVHGAQRGARAAVMGRVAASATRSGSRRRWRRRGARWLARSSCSASRSSSSSASGRGRARRRRGAACASSAIWRSSSRMIAPMSGPTPSISSSTRLASRRWSRASRRTISAKTGQRWGNPLYRWDVLRDERLSLVDRPRAPGAASLRHHSPGPLPRLRVVLGGSGQFPGRRRAGRGRRGRGRTFFDRDSRGAGRGSRSSPRTWA